MKKALPLAVRKSPIVVISASSNGTFGPATTSTAQPSSVPPPPNSDTFSTL